jgi:hypothetical protein
MKVFGKKDTEEVHFKRWNEPLNPEKSTYVDELLLFVHQRKLGWLQRCPASLVG